jgi:hypothetical protein
MYCSNQMYSTYTKMFGMCRGSTPATTDCRTFVDPQLKSYFIPLGVKNPPNDEQELSKAWGTPSQATANSYRYNEFEPQPEDILKKLAEEHKDSKKNGKDNVKEGFCSIDGKNSCGGSMTSIGNDSNLASILDPRFNLREACKHMILLEDHLFHPERRCKDCCCKHLLTIEAFLEEAITLDKTLQYQQIINQSLSDFKQFGKELCQKVKAGPLSDDDCCRFAQKLRQIRKPLCQEYATFI